MESWNDRVADYVSQLEQVVDEIDLCLQEHPVDSGQQTPADREGSSRYLQSRLAALETKVAQREALLRAADAPSAGLTIIQKLNMTGNKRLADRADQVAERIQDTYQRSVSLFVCRFHLSNLTSDLVRIMTGGDYPATYGGIDQSVQTPPGGLFNEAA